MNRVTALQPTAPRTSGWRKSTRSADSGNGNCVEMRLAPEGFEVRDSKLGDSSPIIGLTRKDFTGLLAAARRGEVA
jgi:hypothetical protein